MSAQAPEQLNVRLLLFTFEARGPRTVRLIGWAASLLILAVAMSVLIISVALAISSPASAASGQVNTETTAWN